MASRGSAGAVRGGLSRALCPPGLRSFCTFPFIAIALLAAVCGAGLALLSDDSNSSSDHRPLSLSKQDRNLPQWLGPDPRLHKIQATVTDKRLETALKTAVDRLREQDAELATLRSLKLSQTVSKPQTSSLVTYPIQKPHESSTGGHALSLDLAKGVGQMGLPRASAMSGTDQGMISSDPASASRADESLDAGFVQQLQQKQKTPKRLSKEILNQLGLRGGGMGGIQTGGTSGEETNFVEHIQRQQAGGLPQAADEGSKECGRWQEQYTLLHSNIVAGRGPQRYLTFSCRLKCEDLGEALLGLASSFMVAVLTRRAFILDWPAGKKVFDTVQVDWRGGGERMPPGVGLKGAGGAVNLDDVYHTVEEGGLEQLFSQAYKTGNVVLSWRKGVIGAMMEHKKGRWPVLLRKMGLREDNALGCNLRYLLTPKAEVVGSLRPYFDALGSASSASVCVQPPLDTQATEPFFQCAQAVTQKRYKSDQDVRWLLIGGTNSAHAIAKTRHVGEVLVLASNASREPFGSDPKLDKAALGEWLLLSQCHVLVVDTSAYAVSAASYSLHSVLIYPMEAGKGGHRPDSCLPEKPATLEELMDPNKGFTV